MADKHVVKYNYVWLEDRLNHFLGMDEVEDEQIEEGEEYRSPEKVEKLSPYNDPNYEMIINSLQEYLSSAGMSGVLTSESFSGVEDDDFEDYKRYLCRVKEIPFYQSLGRERDLNNYLRVNLPPILPNANKAPTIPFPFLKTVPIMKF